MKALFYLLVAYLPFQLALNLSDEIDLLSGRVLILALFVVWVIQFLKRILAAKACLGDPEQVPAPNCDSARGKNKHSFSIGSSLILFLVLAAVSILAAQNQLWGGRKLLVFVSIFPLFFLARSVIKNEAVLKKTIWILIGGAALHSLFAICQFLAQFIFSGKAVGAFYGAYIGPSFWGADFSRLVLSDPSWFVDAGGRVVWRAIGLFPDPHMLAFYLGIISPLALGMMLFGSGHKKILFAAYCLMAAVLLLTFSRGGYLGFIASSAVFFVYGWRRLEVGGRKFVFGFLGLFLISTAILGAPLAARFFSSFDLSEGSNFGRLEVWRQSFGVAAQNLISGVGLGNYPLAAGASDVYRSAVTSHNVYLDILAETGIFGLAAWLAVFFFAMLGLQRRIKDKNMPADIFGLSVGLMAALSYFLVHSFFETAIFNPTILGMSMIILGMTGFNNAKCKSQKLK